MCLQAGETDADGVVIVQDDQLLVDAITALEGKRVQLLSIMHKHYIRSA